MFLFAVYLLKNCLQMECRKGFVLPKTIFTAELGIMKFEKT